MADQKISKKQSADYLRELEELSKDPQYSRPDSPSTDALAEAMNRARQLQEKQATRNEWGQVAEMVGRALTKYGAAQAGAKQGVDVVSKMDLGPGIDWESRQRRAMDQYRQSVGEADAAYRRDRDAASELAGRRKEDFGRQEGYLQTALRDAQQRERDEAQAAREEARLRQSLGREDARFKKEDARLDLQDRREILKDLTAQEEDLAKRADAAEQLANAYSLSKKADKKTKEKLLQTKPKLAADAGINLDQLEAEATTPGWFTNKVDQKTIQQGISNRAQTLKESLNKLREEKKRILSRDRQEQPTEAQSSMVRVISPNGTIGEIPRDRLDEALKAGATLVE